MARHFFIDRILSFFRRGRGRFLLLAFLLQYFLYLYIQLLRHLHHAVIVRMQAVHRRFLLNRVASKAILHTAAVKIKMAVPLRDPPPVGFNFHLNLLFRYRNGFCKAIEWEYRQCVEQNRRVWVPPPQNIQKCRQMCPQI